MSKIEQALEKAKARATPKPSATTSEPGFHLIPADNAQENAAREAYEGAGRAIALMQEPWSLSRKELTDNKIIYPGMEDTRVANSFREARTKILKATSGKNCVILVTSATQASGCSFVALNLAVAFSFDESKTALLVDGNLSDPSFQNLVPPERDHGLTDYLSSDDLNVEHIIHPVGIQRLRLIPAGKKYAAGVEYFTSAKMRGLLRIIRERYPDRYIIIDAPPIMESADTRILAEVCDYALLVVAYNTQTESQLITAANAIGRQKLMGIVFNDEPQLPKFSWITKFSSQVEQFLKRKQRQ